MALSSAAKAIKARSKPQANVVVAKQASGQYKVIQGYTTGQGGYNPDGTPKAPVENIEQYYKERQAEEAIKKQEEEQKQKEAAEEAKRVEELKRIAQEQYKGKERPAETAARLSVLEAGREQTKFGELVARRREEMVKKAGAEAQTAHYLQKGTAKTETVQAYQVSGSPKQEKAPTAAIFTGKEPVSGTPSPEPPKAKQPLLQTASKTFFNVQTDIFKKQVATSEKVKKATTDYFQNKQTEYREAAKYTNVKFKEKTITNKERIAAAGLSLGYASSEFAKGVIIPLINPLSISKPQPITKTAALAILGPSGQSLYENIELATSETPFADISAQAGTYTLFAGAGKGLEIYAKAAAKPQKALFIEYEIQPKKISAQELNFLKKYQIKLTPEMVTALEDYKGQKLPQESVTVDISKLSDKNIKRLIKMQEEGKIKSEFEITTKQTEAPRVGFSIKKKYTESAATIKARQSIGEKFVNLFRGEGKKTFVEVEKSDIAAQEKILSYEAEIRKKMAETGKSAKEVYEEIKQEEKIAGWKKLENQAKTTAGEPSTSVNFDGPPLSAQSPFSKLSSVYGRQEAVEVYQEPLEPMEVVTLPTAEKIEFAKTAYTGGKILQFNKVNIKTGSLFNTKSDIKAGVKLYQSITPKTESIENYMQSVKSITQQNQKIKITPIIGQKIYSKQKAEQKQKVGQITTQSTKLTQVLTPTTEQSIKSKAMVKPKLIIETPIKIKIKGSKTTKKRKGLFSVFVRRRGQFKKIAEKPTAQEAYFELKKRLVTTAAASGKVISKEPTISVGKRILQSPIFYGSRREPGVFVQKRRYRIGTPGEKSEITYKGLAKIRMSKARFNLFG